MSAKPVAAKPASTARWVLSVVSLLLVVALTWWDLSRSHAGPGPVHPAHAAVSALDGGANCAACHRDGGLSVAACLDCHDAVRAQVAAGTGLHAAFQESQCSICHPEHHGAEVPLLPPHAYERAGIPDVHSYDHGFVTFELDGAHSQLACVRCHEHAHDTAPPAGGRFLGLSQRCTACHEDVHQQAFGQDCQSCHGQSQPFKEVPGFTHERFALEGAHGQVECAACHEAGSDYDVVREELQSLAVRSCIACHANPHDAAAGVIGKALQLPDAVDCARCHVADTWQSARPSLSEHEQLGFALRGPHAQADCATCHGDSQEQAMWQGKAPELAACAVCHEDPHRGDMLQLQGASPPVNDCAGCHTDSDAAFADGRMSAEHHRLIGFGLDVPHQDLACASCHEGTTREQRFPGRIAADCRGCHTDAHAGQFTEAAGLRQCTECHHEERFVPHRFGVAAHKNTFPLTGAHDAVACNTCHDEVVAGVRQFVGTKQVCSECHDDVHKGQFDRLGLPKLVAGRSGCARCHDTASFRSVLSAFDHKLWTGYELEGAHVGVACVACHDGPEATRLGKVAGKSCASCHSDPHVGQFRVRGQTDCRRCHDSADWSNDHFDHQRDSKFALDGVHKDLACSKCHTSTAVGGRQVVRYKPLGTRCGDCHQLGTGGGRK